MLAVSNLILTIMVQFEITLRKKMYFFMMMEMMLSKNWNVEVMISNFLLNIFVIQL